jgi:hypothetical protein
MKEKNAIITKAEILIERGILTASLRLEYGDSTSQGFGGICLYTPNRKDTAYCGMFIYHLMDVIGVKNWVNLVGKAVRVKSDFDGVRSIGHIVNDNWFSPDELTKLI